MSGKNDPSAGERRERLAFSAFRDYLRAIPHADVRQRRGDIPTSPFRSRLQNGLERGCPRRFNRKKD